MLMLVLFVLGPVFWWLTAKRLRWTTVEAWIAAVLALIAMLLLPLVFSTLLWSVGIRNAGWTADVAITMAFELAVAIIAYQKLREPQWHYYDEQADTIERR